MEKLFSKKLISWVNTVFLKFRIFYVLENTFRLVEGSKFRSDFTQKNCFIFTKLFWYVNIKLSYYLRILNPIINGINLIKKHKRLLAALFASANYRQGQAEWQQLSSWKKKTKHACHKRASCTVFALGVRSQRTPIKEQCSCVFFRKNPCRVCGSMRSIRRDSHGEEEEEEEEKEEETEEEGR